MKPITNEEIEDYIATHLAYALLTGFSSSEEMEDFKVEASLGMIRYGGSFARHLGEALARADSGNTAKLIKAFRPMCEEFREKYRKHGN
jgi:hypothetical protein